MGDQIILCYFKVKMIKLQHGLVKRIAKNQADGSFFRCSSGLEGAFSMKINSISGWAMGA